VRVRVRVSVQAVGWRVCAEVREARRATRRACGAWRARPAAWLRTLKDARRLFGGQFDRDIAKVDNVLREGDGRSDGLADDLERHGVATGCAHLVVVGGEGARHLGRVEHRDGQLAVRRDDARLGLEGEDRLDVALSAHNLEARVDERRVAQLELGRAALAREHLAVVDLLGARRDEWVLSNAAQLDHVGGVARHRAHTIGHEDRRLRRLESGRNLRGAARCDLTADGLQREGSLVLPREAHRHFAVVRHGESLVLAACGACIGEPLSGHASGRDVRVRTTAALAACEGVCAKAAWLRMYAAAYVSCTGQKPKSRLVGTYECICGMCARMGTTKTPFSVVNSMQSSYSSRRIGRKWI
jgi:hypothetical protein